MTAAQQPVDVCTDPNNCGRCKAHPNERIGLHHAGIAAATSGTIRVGSETCSREWMREAIKAGMAQS